MAETPPQLKLRFHPRAWAKLLLWRDLAPGEVGGYGISRTADPLFVVDFVPVEQEASAAMVNFLAPAMAQHVIDMHQKGFDPDECTRIWIHTHPGDSPTPSSQDETTFRDNYCHATWAVMMILAKGGQAYARLSAKVFPGTANDARLSVVLSCVVCWDALLDVEKEREDFKRLVHPYAPRSNNTTTSTTGPSSDFSSGIPLKPDDTTKPVTPIIGWKTRSFLSHNSQVIQWGNIINGCSIARPTSVTERNNWTDPKNWAQSKQAIYLLNPADNVLHGWIKPNQPTGFAKYIIERADWVQESVEKPKTDDTPLLLADEDKSEVPDYDFSVPALAYNANGDVIRSWIDPPNHWEIVPNAANPTGMVWKNPLNPTGYYVSYSMNEILESQWLSDMYDVLENASLTK